jgi:hypothetical protein
MPVTCNTSDAPTLVRYIFDGEWSARDLIERREELIRMGQLTPNSGVLFDLRKVTTFPPLSDLQLALHAATTHAIFPAFRAFLATSQQQYDGARQLQALLGPHSVINETFRDEEAAIEWLGALAGRTDSSRG